MSQEHEAFAPEGAQERERIRSELSQSALAMQKERITAETSGGKIPTIEERIKALGFDGEAVKIFDLLPLVHVAWADGSIQHGERATILNLLQIRGIGAGKAFTTMEALLEKKPSKPYMDESLEVLKEMIKDEPAKAETIVGLCILLAESAGGFLGIFRRTSPEEKDMIRTIAERLGEAAQQELARQLA